MPRMHKRMWQVSTVYHRGKRGGGGGKTGDGSMREISTRGVYRQHCHCSASDCLVYVCCRRSAALG